MPVALLHRHRATIDAAEAKRSAQGAQVLARQSAIISEVESLRRQAAALRDAVDAAAAAVDSSAAQLKLAQRQFDAGSIDALKDEDVSTRVSSNAVGQRLSFSLTGPTGPAAVAAIAGVHVKQIAQAGTVGPQSVAGFLRMGGVNHGAVPVTVPSLAPRAIYSTWALNPADNSAWTSVSLPAEVGILSA